MVTFCNVPFLVAFGLTLPPALQGQSVILVECHDMCNLDTSLVQNSSRALATLPPREIQTRVLYLRPFHLQLRPRYFCLPRSNMLEPSLLPRDTLTTGPPLEMANPYLPCMSPLQPTAPGKPSLTTSPEMCHPTLCAAYVPLFCTVLEPPGTILGVLVCVCVPAIWHSDWLSVNIFQTNWMVTCPLDSLSQCSCPCPHPRWAPL